MSAWVLIPCLVALRTEFNLLAPNRDKGADGSIGDTAHTSSSDHTPDEDSAVLRDHDADSKNEVHALDIDSTGPWPDGRTFRSIVLGIIAAERAKWLDPDDKCRLRYVIFDRKIYHLDNDFQPRDYTGSDPHTNHAHFSGRYDSDTEADTRPWGVLIEGDDPMPFIENQADFDAAMSKWWNRVMNSADTTPGPELNFLRRAPWNLVTTAPDTMYARVNRLETKANEVAAELAEVSAALAEVKALLTQAKG